MKNLRIVFMGTPNFAVESLKALVENNYNVVAVVTAPDKPTGRGRKMKPSPVKKYAESVDLDVLQPDNLKYPVFLWQLGDLRPDLIVVVAFRMLPREVWNLPEYGTINLHASLLPQYRGAAPINHAIINGEKQTGLTTFFIDEEIDTGKIILQEKMNIGDEETAGELHDRMMKQGAKLVLKTVDAIEKRDVQEVEQDELLDTKELKKAPKIFKEDCLIDWEKPVREIYNFIRGLSPLPVAWTEIVKNNQRKTNVKIYKADYKEEKHDNNIGKVITDNKNYFHIAAGNGVIIVKELQLPGRKRMSIQEFLRGNQAENWCVEVDD